MWHDNWKLIPTNLNLKKLNVIYSDGLKKIWEFDTFIHPDFVDLLLNKCCWCKVVREKSTVFILSSQKETKNWVQLKVFASKFQKKNSGSKNQTHFSLCVKKIAIVLTHHLSISILLFKILTQNQKNVCKNHQNDVNYSLKVKENTSFWELTFFSCHQIPLSKIQSVQKKIKIEFSIYKKIEKT